MGKEEINRSYYAIIPANVRYDKDITANAKLLYGEITALCNEKGYCWAENEYFAELYDVSKTSISKWINSLVKKGYIFSEIIYKKNTKEIDHRCLRIIIHPIEEKLNTPIEEKLKDNNTIINNTLKEINKRKQFEAPTYDEIKAYAKERNRLDLVDKFYNYYEASGWKDNRGGKVKNWKLKFVSWENNNPIKPIVSSKPQETPFKRTVRIIG